ncbi:MAG: hypothetical protein HYZ89_02335, partial [Candidatus Omnitrophica bacterium]|nr:hypothetical protein [Candidatus Omnitrophota bacterium]
MSWRSRGCLVSAVSMLLTGVAAHSSAMAEESSALAGQKTWTFDADQPGQAPAGFSFGRTGRGAPGRWIVQADKDAPSPTNVLAQVDSDQTDYRFPVAVANEPVLRDMRLS